MKGRIMFSAYRKIMQRRAAEETEGGFTLIELLIVIVVLGILAAVVVFALGGITGKSAVSACEADGTTIQTALAAFATNNPTLTPTIPMLLPQTGSSTTVSDGGPYLQSWPSNLPHYAYALSSTGQLEIATSPPGQVTSGSALSPYTGVSSCSGVQ
jgi:general secretion pathway protein G